MFAIKYVMVLSLFEAQATHLLQRLVQLKVTKDFQENNLDSYRL